MHLPTPLRPMLERSRALLTPYAAVAAFATYFCMYAFRKPFSAGVYEGMTFLGSAVELKTVFVISQIIGYTLSKFIGIKVCSEANRDARALWLLGLIAAAEAALLLFAVVPGELKVAAIFLNGIPLGMVWGLVVSFLEGRKTSELLMAGLCCSFILASGVVKDVGRWVMDPEVWGVPEFWMPFVVGLMFAVPFFISVWLLNQIPEPDAEDIAERSERKPMESRSRWAFVRRFWAGLLMLIVAYFFLTAYRDYRDNYGIDVFIELGYGEEDAIFTKTEIWVAFGVMAAMAMINIIRNHTWGLVAAFVMMTSGMVVLGGSTLLFEVKAIEGNTWMIANGLGSYLAYVPFNAVLFERVLAYTRAEGNAVFAIYLADAFGYVGSVGIQLYKDLFAGDSSRLEFFVGYTYTMSVLGCILFVGGCIYFLRQRQGEAPATTTPQEAPT